MFNQLNISPGKQKLFVYIILVLITLSVFWQVNQFDFINLDDNIYITDNSHIQSGITPEGLHWAFSTHYTGYWYPLIWLSFMFDYQLFGLNAGGYHLTNLILHILSTLLLFWLFNRMTGAIWKSAFVAALFALHPMHVESVAWVTERKDVLSAFFWMLTLCLYVYYTEKPAIKRYLLVLFSFVLALMSKPMAVTLPVIMILLDYWPLSRLLSHKKKLSETKIAGIIPLWQLKEKIPYFVLSMVFSVITLIVHEKPDRVIFPFSARIANAPVSFVTYLEKTFWPHDLAVYYPFSDQLPAWQIFGATLLILVISSAVIVMVKRLPYLFFGWLWYVITIVPVIGIIQAGEQAMADRFHYLPSIGISIMLAWGVPELLKRWKYRKEILFTSSALIILCFSMITWTQVGYWQNSITLFNHALKVTHHNWRAFNNLAHAYNNLGNYKQAIEGYNRTLEIKPDHVEAYLNRGLAYAHLGDYGQAIEDFNRAIEIKPGHAKAYNNCGNAYVALGNYKQAMVSYGRAIEIDPGYAEAYNNRAIVYLSQGDNISGCRDARKACALGNCKLLEMAKGQGDCR